MNSLLAKLLCSPSRLRYRRAERSVVCRSVFEWSLSRTIVSSGRSVENCKKVVTAMNSAALIAISCFVLAHATGTSIIFNDLIFSSDVLKSRKQKWLLIEIFCHQREVWTERIWNASDGRITMWLLPPTIRISRATTSPITSTLEEKNWGRFRYVITSNDSSYSCVISARGYYRDEKRCRVYHKFVSS